MENLSEMFEKPVPELAQLKGDILNKTAYCNRRRVVLLSDTAENLKKGKKRFLFVDTRRLEADYMTPRGMDFQSRVVMGNGRKKD